MAGHKTLVAEELLASESGLDKPETNAHATVASVAGGFQDRNKKELEQDALEDVRALLAEDAMEISQ